MIYQTIFLQLSTRAILADVLEAPLTTVVLKEFGNNTQQVST